MPGTHEELFALLTLVSDPEAFRKKLETLDTATKAAAEERKLASEARDEASANNATAQKALRDAMEVTKKGALDLAAAQDRKDKADIARGEATQLQERNRQTLEALNESEKKLNFREAQLKKREEELTSAEAKTETLQKELYEKLTKLKAIAT